MKNVSILAKPSDGSARTRRGGPARRAITAHPQCNGLHRKRRWTDRALMNLPRDGYKYELFDGEIIKSPAGCKHGDICAKIIVRVGAFVERHKLGNVYDGQTGFRLIHGFKRKTVLSPDVSFVARARVQVVTDPDKFFEGAPDLAVEVLSPGDTLSATEEKVRRFFLNGTRLAWIVDPISRCVHVRTPGEEGFTVEVGGRLDGGEILPGLRLLVRQVLM